MEAIENIRARERKGSIDRWLDAENERLSGVKPGKVHPLDEENMKRLQRRLREWYDQEREKQAANRYQMALDQDFYDNLQWDEEDAAELRERGQAPLVFNVVASTVDWIIGTEKRTRVDFKVLPRADDDVQGADDKTKVLKYISDVNKTPYYRSLAFADAVKVGVGWVEDSAVADPSREPCYSGYENWRNVLWDSAGHDRAGKDWRYQYRWKWVDLDIAIAMFPDREAQLRKAAVAANLWGSEEDEDFWYLGQHFQSRNAQGEVIGRRTFVSDTALVNNRRARVKLIEAWYRIPERCFICRGEVFNGESFDKSNPTMVKAALEGVISLIDALRMKVRVAIMTEGDLLQEMPSPYRHDRFPLTPIWCYIRGRDRLPYGVIRRVRDPQEDLNKRASKALFLFSTNRIIADHDALDGTGLTWDDIREEAARPDALITKKKGSEFTFDNQLQAGEEQLMLMDRNERMIQHAGGVTDDNLGRRTNAISGEAIKARQLQGSVVTAEIFDNVRFAVQTSGEIQLSNAEQFISEPKAIRLVGSRGKLDWVKINQPEVQPDGTVRFLNDITARQADFVVDEQDFHQSVRQSMFESMTELVGRIAAVNNDAALRILRMALEFSDLPNKDEMAGEIKDMLGLVDEKDLEQMTPEERQQHQAQMQEREAARQLQIRAAELEVAEKAAKIQKMEAEAQKVAADAERIRAEAQGLLNGDGAAAAEARFEFERKVADIERRSAEAIDRAREEIEDLNAKLRDRQHEINKKAETDVEVARINAQAKIDEARIVDRFQKAMDTLAEQLREALAEVKAVAGKQDKLERGAEKERVERGAKDKADSEAAVKREKEKKAEQPEQTKGPLVVFETGAIQVSGPPAVGKTVKAKVGGKEVELRIEPDAGSGPGKPKEKKS